jgi:hypothetical protein
MKVCPICGSTYEKAVDFCFKDGAPLDEAEQAAGQAAVSSRPDLSSVSMDDLDAPDAISLSNIPAVSPEDDVATQTLPTDLVEPDEMVRTSGTLRAVTELPVNPEPDATGIVDPFGGIEAELWKKRRDAERAHGADVEATPTEPVTAAVGAPSPAASVRAPDPAALPDTDGVRSLPEAMAGAAPPSAEATPGSPPTPAAGVAAPPSDGAKAPSPAPAAASAARPPGPALSSAASRARGGAAAARRSDSSDADLAAAAPGGGLRTFAAVAAIAAALLVAVLGWQLMKDGSEQPRAAAAPALSMPTPAPRPAATPEPVPEPTPLAAELAESSPAEGAEPGAAGAGAEAGATPGAGAGGAVAVAGTGPAAGGPTPSPVDPRAADLERQRREEEARRRQQGGAPEPPFRLGGAEPTPAASSSGGGVAASGNPWGAGASPSPSPTPAAAADPSNPWGAPAAQSGQLLVSSQPGGARVTVAGKSRGSTPATVDLPFGDHEIRIEAKGFATQTRVVKVAGTKPISLDIVLEPLERVAQGTMNVVTATPALLFVDGVSRGKTPLSISISAGRHRFRLEADGRPPYEEQVDVQIADGEAITRFFNIPP